MRSACPGSETRRKALAVQYGRDGYHLLEAVRAARQAWLRELPAAGTLRAVWIQQYYRSSDEHGEKVARYSQSTAKAGSGTRSTAPKPAAIRQTTTLTPACHRHRT